RQRAAAPAHRVGAARTVSGCLAGARESATAAAVAGTLPAGGASTRAGTGASGVSYSTYDQHSGTFVDAKGNAAVYAPGADNLRPQENWVDLMLDPRQT